MWKWSNLAEWLGMRQASLFDEEFLQSNHIDRDEYRLAVLDAVVRKRKAKGTLPPDYSIEPNQQPPFEL